MRGTILAVLAATACGTAFGGGPDVDMQKTGAALTDWVARDVAPCTMVGTTLNGGTKRIEPWCGEAVGLKDAK